MHFLGIALILLLNELSTTAEKAQRLAHYDKTNGTFELNYDASSQLSHLPRSVKVIAAIGEPHLRKSATLNLVRHVLNCDADEKPEAEIEEVFETGDSCGALTYGIWMSVCEKENIVVLDVEVPNVGDEAVKAYMNGFIFRVSSTIVVFSSQTVTNDIVNSLYTVTRLSEHTFKDEAGIDSINKFGHIHIVIHDPLTASPGKTFEDEVRDMLITPSGEDEATDNKRSVIAKNFQKRITVSGMPLINCNRQLLKDIQIKEKVEFRGAIQSLAQWFKTFPAKTTFEGIVADGEALVQIAETAIEMINRNLWSDFGDTYAMVEKYLCDKIFQATVAPTLALETADEIEQRKESVLNSFKDGCALTEEVNKASDLLTTAISDKREKKIVQERLKEANDKEEIAILDVMIKLKESVMDLVIDIDEIWKNFNNVTNEFLSQPNIIERYFLEYRFIAGAVLGYALCAYPRRILAWLLLNRA